MEKSGLPRPDPLFGQRRYWPAVRAFLDRRAGMAQSLAPLTRDGEEKWDDDRGRKSQLGRKRMVRANGRVNAYWVRFAGRCEGGLSAKDCSLKRRSWRRRRDAGNCGQVSRPLGRDARVHGRRRARAERRVDRNYRLGRRPLSDRPGQAPIGESGPRPGQATIGRWRSFARPLTSAASTR